VLRRPGSSGKPSTRTGPEVIRKILKAGVERGLLWSGAARLRRAQHRSRVLVLAYHNVVPDGQVVAGEASLHLPRARFVAQLEALRRSHDVVALDTVLESTSAGRRRPRVVITFDDAYRGAVTVGVDELARRGLPATVFVAPAFVDGASFWWDCLSDPMAGEVPPAVREHALAVLGGDDVAVRGWAVEQGIQIHSPVPNAVGATVDELAAAARCPGITFGSHTWSHPNLTALDLTELRMQVERPLTWLRERFENVVPWLSYPYGLTSPAVEAVVREAGYSGALRVDGGWIPEQIASPFALPRYNVPAGLSDAGFQLRSSGLFCD
jgi:peptidoglycan/xylan/chitin deacetylase (PgdA/CDA1 family)